MSKSLFTIKTGTVFALIPTSPFNGNRHVRGVELFQTFEDARRAQSFYGPGLVIDEIPLMRTELDR